MTGSQESPDSVHCRRLGRALPPEKHLSCSYCNGDAQAVATGDHEQFCSFDPDKDPVSFGFPQDGTRLQRG